MIWSGFKGPAYLAVIEMTMNYSLWAMQHFPLGSKWVIQQDNKPKNHGKSQTDCAGEVHINMHQQT